MEEKTITYKLLVPFKKLDGSICEELTFQPIKAKHLKNKPTNDSQLYSQAQLIGMSARLNPDEVEELDWRDIVAILQLDIPFFGTTEKTGPMPSGA